MPTRTKSQGTSSRRTRSSEGTATRKSTTRAPRRRAADSRSSSESSTPRARSSGVRGDWEESGSPRRGQGNGMSNARRGQADTAHSRRGQPNDTANSRRGQANELVNLIKEDHRNVQDLFRRFESGSRPEERKQIADEVLHELGIHSEIEQRIVYPAFEGRMSEGRSGRGDKEVNEALEEHHVVQLLSDELRDMRPEDDHFAAKFKVLAENVRHHIQEEETRLLPQLSRADLDLNALAQEYRQMKDEMMAGAGSAMGTRGRSSGARAGGGRTGSSSRSTTGTSRRRVTR
jgi:hypothetical protein